MSCECPLPRLWGRVVVLPAAESCCILGGSVDEVEVEVEEEEVEEKEEEEELITFG